MSMPIRLLSLLAMVVLGLPSAQGETPPAGDAAHGAKLAYTCFGCHGIPDYRNVYPTYHVPKLKGQHGAYLVAALNEYKNGARRHPTMSGQAGSFDEAAIRDLAAYFATPRPVESPGHAAGQAPAAAAVCQACHGLDGVGIVADYPTLTGQYADYLVQALKSYRQGARQNPIMQGFAANLKDEEIRALADYFARQSPGLDVAEPPHRGR
jgi:cytochrome c553